MDRHDDFILTHYSEIADEKRAETRRLQAEMTRSFLRALGAMLGKPLKRSANRAGEQVLDRARSRAGRPPVAPGVRMARALA